MPEVPPLSRAKPRLNHNSHMWFAMMIITIININIWTPLTGRPEVRGQHTMLLIRAAPLVSRVFDLVSAIPFSQRLLLLGVPPPDSVWPSRRGASHTVSSPSRALNDPHPISCSLRRCVWQDSKDQMIRGITHPQGKFTSPPAACTD